MGIWGFSVRIGAIPQEVKEPNPVNHGATSLISPESPIMLSLHMAQLLIRVRRGCRGQETDGVPAWRAGLS